MKYIDQGLQLIDDVSDLVSSKKEFIIREVINIVLIVIIMLMFGCFDFMHVEFHFEYLGQANYWMNILTKTIADICSFNVGINLVLEENIKRDKVLRFNKALYEKLNRYRDSKDFDIYINHVYNKEMRILAYKAKISNQIKWLNRFSRKSDRLLYISEDPSKQELKLTNKYCILRKQLENLKSDEYISKNYESLNVFYRDVDPSIFGLEIDGSDKVVQNKVTGSIAAGRVKASITTVLSVVAASMFLTSLFLSPDKEELEEGLVRAANYIIRAVSDAGIVIWQLFRGIIKSKGIVSSQLTVPYSERVKILKGYYSWRQDNNKSVPQIFLDLTEEVTYEEVSEEVYNKMKGEE